VLTKDQKNMYPRKTIHEKSRRIIYELSLIQTIYRLKYLLNLYKYLLN
jgi:hypothetical protein